MKMYKRYKKNKNTHTSFNGWLLDNKSITNEQAYDINNAMVMYKDINKELNNYKYFAIRLGCR